MEKKLSDMRKQTGGKTATSSEVVAPPPPPSSSEPLTTGGGSPSAGRTFEGMYHVTAPRSVSEVDIGNVHDLSAGGGAITAHHLHGKLPHRFQNRRQPKGSSGDDLDSVHSGDSGVTSGGAAGLVSSTSSGYSSLSPSPSPSLGGARASGASSTTCLWEDNTAGLPAPSTSHTMTRVGRRLASVPGCHTDQHPFPDDSSSQDSNTEGCLSRKGSKQSLPDRSSGFCSPVARNSPEKLSVSVSFDEDYCSVSESAHNRSKHFIVSRGPQRSRLTEVKVRSREGSYSELPSQSRIVVDLVREASENPSVARLAKAEPDQDLDNSCCAAVWEDEEDVEDESSRGCSSFGGDTSFGGDSEDMEEYRLWREEQRFSTRVQRRKQTVILSRSLRRQQVDLIEKGYKAFENIYMGDVGADTSFSSSRGRSLARNPHAKCPSTGQVRRDMRATGLTGSAYSQTEIGHKIQDLISSTSNESRRRSVRSRSFDSSKNNRSMVNSAMGEVGNRRANQTIDDIRLADLPSKRKNSTTSLGKKSAALFSKMRDRPKQMTSRIGDVPVEQAECAAPSSQFLRSGCLGGCNSPNMKYETNFGVIAGNIKAASSNTESRLPSSPELGSGVLRRNPHLLSVDRHDSGQEGERCSAGNVTSSTIRDSSSSSSISTGSEGCTTPISSASVSGDGSSGDDGEYFPGNAKNWQQQQQHGKCSLETAVWVWSGIERLVLKYIAGSFQCHINWSFTKKNITINFYTKPFFGDV